MRKINKENRDKNYELYLHFSQFSNDIEVFVSFHFRLFKGGL